MANDVQFTEESLAQYPELKSFLESEAPEAQAMEVNLRNIYNLRRSDLGGINGFNLLKICSFLGKLSHIKVLQSFGDELKEAVKADNYGAIQGAIYNGHTATIQHLETHLRPEEKREAVKADNYAAIRYAAKNGHTATIQHLETHLTPEEKREAVKADNYDNYLAIQWAAENGHTATIQHLETHLTAQEKQAAVKANRYWTIQLAAEKGHTDTIQHLETHLTEQEKIEAVKANDYLAIRWAAENGHTATIQHLETHLTPEEKKAAVKARDYYAIRKAAKNGHSATIQYLETHLTPEEKKEAAKARDYYAIRKAAKNGHSATIQYLETHLTPEEKKEAAKARDYYAIRKAAKNGHTATIQYIETHLTPKEKKEAAKADRYYAIRSAAENGHTATIQYLENHLMQEEKKEAAKAYNYGGIRNAAINGHITTVHYFLHYKEALAYMESHDREYGTSYTYPFVTEKITGLKQEKEHFEQEQPTGVFNLEEKDAQLAFYLLRNLIRRGVARDHAPAQELEDEMLFLLSIPSVRALCHRPVGEAGVENELLKLALSLGNETAAALLLQLPDVRRLAEVNQFYQNVANGLDLRQLAQDRESSMLALSVSEKELLDRLKGHYQEKISAVGGETKVFEGLKADLKARYEANPACIELIDPDAGKRLQSLPFAWSDLQALRPALGEENYQAALKAYYQHDVHSAYRYLSKPNHWMAENASFVYVYHDEQGKMTPLRYATFEEYQPLISLLYMAANDENAPAVDGYTLESRKDLFIKQLALIARAHNWDKSRPIVKDEQCQYDARGHLCMEEYDDLMGDKPSCYSGVIRRLFQSVLGHPLFKPLTDNLVKQALNEHIRVYFQEVITRENARLLEDAFVGYITMDDNRQEYLKILQSIDIPDSIKKSMIEQVCVQLEASYMESFTTHKGKFIQSMHSYLESLHKHSENDFSAFYLSLELEKVIDAKKPEQNNNATLAESTALRQNGLFAAHSMSAETEGLDDMAEHREGFTASYCILI